MPIKTLIGALGLSDLAGSQDELFAYIDAEYDACAKKSDVLGAGEWLANKLVHVSDAEVDRLLSQVIALWASVDHLPQLPASLAELTKRATEFAQEDLVVALIAAIIYVRGTSRQIPSAIGNLGFRLRESIRTYFELKSVRETEVLDAAAAKVEGAQRELVLLVRAFARSNAIAAKRTSIDLVRALRNVKRYIVPSERVLATAADALLGPTFRRFCEGYEKNDALGIVTTGNELRRQATSIISGSGKHTSSTFWNVILAPTAEHIVRLVDEGAARSAVATTPSLRLASKIVKSDLSNGDSDVVIRCRLVNAGEGRAVGISVTLNSAGAKADIATIEPSQPFDLDGRSERILVLALTCYEPRATLSLPLSWACTTIDGRAHTDPDVLTIQQQRAQPDWHALAASPPYTLNPIKSREHLFGRDEILATLHLNAAGGTSTFLWGQKRIGKTSVLQVLAKELSRGTDFVCVVLRMGEVIGLHEGQIAYTIARRLHDQLHLGPPPAEDDFGAGMGPLIPFVEDMVKRNSTVRLVVIIDEFDDLNPAFYTGERGRLFVKALRSLSEVGLTFFFVGSERMDAIYRRHEVELNKWVNVSLDRISSREDCKSLIRKPVHGAIEYEAECVDEIIDFCGKNPFYMHLLCRELFQRCFTERRTFVADTDLAAVRATWLKAVGRTTFSHFWEDNPELDPAAKQREAAESCLLLACVASNGGSFKSVDDLAGIQDRLGLGAAEQLAGRHLKSISDRLLRRHVLETVDGGTETRVALPVFREWLALHAELLLLPEWREHILTRATPEAQQFKKVAVSESHFPIDEEELLAVSQALMFCGKQKDATEIRVWLRQFDDDVRIEIAFLLLKRLAERGYISEGAKGMALERVVESIQSIRRKLGRGAWVDVRSKRDNLCITYVDSEMKSGATTARELAKRLRPGKQGPPDSIIDWMRSRVDKDPIVVVADDFSGTGTTVSKGLEKLISRIKSESKLSAYFGERRVFCFLLYAFPEALDKLRHDHPDVEFAAINVFDDQVRALSDNSEIFANEKEIGVAEEILTQLGRELYPDFPFGYGDLGALVCFHDSIPNNTLPIFWSGGKVNERAWKPLFPRA